MKSERCLPVFGSSDKEIHDHKNRVEQLVGDLVPRIADLCLLRTLSSSRHLKIHVDLFSFFLSWYLLLFTA